MASDENADGGAMVVRVTSAPESCNLCSVGTRASVFDVALEADDKVVEGKTAWTVCTTQVGRS